MEWFKQVSFSTAHPDPEIRKRLNLAFEAWSDSADADRLTAAERQRIAAIINAPEANGFEDH